MTRRHAETPTNLVRFSGLWTLAVQEGWAAYNICEKIQSFNPPSPEVRIYPNNVVMNLLAGCLHNEATQAVLAELVLGLFGCLRPEEVQSLKALRNGHQPFTWRDIDLKHKRATVSREVAKKGDQRTVCLQPVAVELCKKFDNPLPPINERRLVDAICDLIGLDEWLHDGLRKNCATHLRAVYKNDYDVVKDMGHSVRVLLEHCAALHISQEESDE